MNYVKAKIQKSGKKYYEILIGKINEPKLKNISFVIIFILFD